MNENNVVPMGLSNPLAFFYHNIAPMVLKIIRFHIMPGRTGELVK